MTHDSTQRVLCHWYKRQEESSPESAFRFLQYVGKKNNMLLANYPTLADNSNGGRGDEEVPQRLDTPKSKRRKGKERQVEQLDGLLPIGQMAQLDPSWHNDRSAGASNLIGSSNDDLVRIDMGQMKVLWDWGLNVWGLVNGPNEGLPQYEVPRSWLHFIPAHQSSAGPSSQSLNSQPYPRPRPILPTNIGSSLLLPTDKNAQLKSRPMPVPIQSDPPDLHPETTHMMAVDHSTEDQNRPYLAAHSMVQHNSADDQDRPVPALHPTPKKRLGKRNQAHLSPQAKRQTRNSAKRKKIGDDERAAMEAKEFLTSGTRQRKKPNRR